MGRYGAPFTFSLVLIMTSFAMPQGVTVEEMVTAMSSDDTNRPEAKAEAEAAPAPEPKRRSKAES